MAWGVFGGGGLLVLLLQDRPSSGAGSTPPTPISLPPPFSLNLGGNPSPHLVLGVSPPPPPHFGGGGGCKNPFCASVLRES